MGNTGQDDAFEYSDFMGCVSVFALILVLVGVGGFFGLRWACLLLGLVGAILFVRAHIEIQKRK